MKKFYITTPLYYVNDKPHIGHAYTTIAADVLARWKRMHGEPVHFLTGTDEHGSKIAQAAEKHGMSPQQYADRIVLDFKSLWKVLNISFDDFIRTTEPRHTKVVQDVLQKLFDKGEVFKGFYEDWYCVYDETFWLESQLVDGKCPECHRPVEKLKEETYFFRLSKYEDRIREVITRNPEFVSPTKHVLETPQAPEYRALEMLEFVKSGLKDLSVSRLKEKWGVPLPFDSNHTTYVWFDALLNYISAAGYGARDGSFESLWPADVHFVGKEILRFHSVIWPAMLMALELPLPKKVFAHGWWTVEGEKMSKSRGNVVDPHAVVADYSVDAFRYFLLREVPFGSDGDFSMDSLRKRYNTELANDLGNLLSRTLTLIEKNLGGRITNVPEKFDFDFGVEKLQGKTGGPGLNLMYEKVALDQVLDQVMGAVRQANLYIEQKAPWKLAKENPEEGAKVLGNCAVLLTWLSAAYYPFMPESCEKMWQQLGQTGNLSEAGGAVLADPFKFVSVGQQVRKEGVLFPRKQDDKK